MPRWFVPEVVQSSGMDCGPAALKSLLEGFGIHASYGRLREACQTGVDGTSIDALEEMAIAMGLDAGQSMAPADHLLVPEAGLLPALAVVRLPNGATHFVVAWRRVGPLLQVMDPGAGRRWMSARRFLNELYIHTQSVPAEAWVGWTRSTGFRKTFARRIAALGIGGTGSLEELLEALQAGGWRTIASLDASIRMTQALVSSGAIARGNEARRLVTKLSGNPDRIPAIYWSVREDPDCPVNVMFRAAVFIHARGRVGQPAESLPEELRAIVEEKQSRPVRDLGRIVWRDAGLVTALAAAALGIAAAGGLIETILLRGLFEVGRDLRIAHQRWWAAGTLLVFLASLALCETGLAALVARIGRGLEVRLRLEFLRKIGRLGDRYFRSRLTSDMAERAHLLHRLRDLPALAAGFLRPLFETALIVAAIAWLYPASLLPAVLTAVVAAVIPMAAHPLLASRDLRWRSHAGALSRFHLDALLGWTAIRAHGAEPAMRREHGSLLGEWARAGLEVQRTVAWVGGAQLFAALALMAWMLLARAGVEQDLGGLLLLVYWALRLPAAGQELAASAWQYPPRRNIALRLLEPLSAPEEPAVVERSEATTSAGVLLQFENVSVRAAGHTLLRDVNLTVSAGEHVGIVGPSGAGKSSLIGLLLGWHVPDKGKVLVDDAPIEAESLRRQTAWVDPEVRLWNRPLLENLRYGSGAGDIERAVEAADLRGVIARLPLGSQSPLGEGGALVSGGEGQRVRLGRALLRGGLRLALLDEPARGLDRTARRSVMHQARQAWREQTLLAVTHDVSDTLELPRVLVMENGGIVEDGDPRELAADPHSRYRALLDAEDAVRRGLWASDRWRRLRLNDGKLVALEPVVTRSIAEVA
jgi:ABC-type bacteriocin/lantibiotic exporter with double-glycine peptidase domain